MSVDLDVRSIYIARPGMILINADYSQAEYRVFAWLTRDPYLLDMYNKGGDIHTGVATDIFGPNFTEEQRVVAKGVNFGLIFGRTARAIAHDPDIRAHLSLDEAEDFVAEYFSRIPVARRKIREIQREAKRKGYLETPFGRRRRFGLITRDNVQHIHNQAVNFPCQSIAGDLTLEAMVRLHQRFEQLAWEAYILLSVHDNLLAECVDDYRRIHDTMLLMEEVMLAVPRETLGDEPPFAVDFSVGYRWGQLRPIFPETYEVV